MTEDRIAALISRVAAGDRAAFRVLASAAAPKLHGVCRRLLGDPAEAETALEESLARVWSAAQKPGPAPIPAHGIDWLVGLARGHALDRLRARPHPAPAPAPAGPLPPLLSGIEPDRARAIRSAYLDGLDLAALADEAGIPRAEARSWLRGGLLQLASAAPDPATAAAHMAEDEGLAAEYVLGTLDTAERLAAEALAAGDARFAGLVAHWQARLAPLASAYAEIPAPPGLAERVEARLFPPAPAPGRRWRWPAAGLALAALAALAVAFLPLPIGREPALYRLEAGDLAFEVRLDPRDGALSAMRAAGAPAPGGRAHQLWILPPGDDPVPLGLIGEAPLAARISAVPEGAALAVSLEPAGGAPGGQPSGPFLARAALAP